MAKPAARPPGTHCQVAGSVSVNLTVENGERYRIATMGPGAVFGELALMDAEPRTADIDAETDVVCYEIHVAELNAGVQSALVSWLARQLAALVFLQRAGQLMGDPETAVDRMRAWKRLTTPGGTRTDSPTAPVKTFTSAESMLTNKS